MYVDDLNFTTTKKQKNKQTNMQMCICVYSMDPKREGEIYLTVRGYRKDLGQLTVRLLNPHQ